MTSAAGPSVPTSRLFVCGEPVDDAIPGGRRRIVHTWTGGGMPIGGTSTGGPAAADLGPGQICGPSARVGRLVLEIARGRTLSVKVVDVNDPGDDRELLRCYGIEESVLPVLVRPDGARLVGDSELEPERLRRFLDGGSRSPRARAPDPGERVG